jgi:hypothetical protein
MTHQTQARITSGQIEAFTKTLVNNNVIDKSDIEVNKDLIEEALKISQSTEGLPMVLYNISPQPNGDIIKTEAKSGYNGQTLTKPIHDSIEIFLALYNTRKSELKAKEQKAQQLLDDALRDWHYFEQKTSATERYNPSLGTWITKDYFIENPYKCAWQAAGCQMRFKTPEEAQRHRYRHGG